MSNRTTDYFSKDYRQSCLLEELYELGKEAHDVPTLGCLPTDTSAEKDACGYKYKGWIFGSKKSHITGAQGLDEISTQCKLTPPEMVFGNNQLVCFHEESGICLQFSAVDGLHAVRSMNPEEQSQLQVDVAKVWKSNDEKSSTKSKEEVAKLKISYDWTYTTDYKGSIQRFKQTSENGFHTNNDKLVLVDHSEEQIDFQKLREREPILWFEDVDLFEDELHDHGASHLNVKMRVMPSGFYCLLTFWMRLDHVTVRVNETRFHHLFNQDFLLREHTIKEKKFNPAMKQLYVSTSEMLKYSNVAQFSPSIPVLSKSTDRIELRN